VTRFSLPIPARAALDAYQAGNSQVRRNRGAFSEKAASPEAPLAVQYDGNDIFR
jgi:hypothetical protein